MSAGYQEREKTTRRKSKEASDMDNKKEKRVPQRDGHDKCGAGAAAEQSPKC